MRRVSDPVITVVVYRLIYLIHGCHGNRIDGCRHPDGGVIQQISQLNMHGHFRNLIMSSREDVLMNGDGETTPLFLSDVDPSYVNKVTMPTVLGRRKCPPVALVRDGTVRICPMYHVVEYDENRSPRTLLQARCACTECQGPTANGEYKRCLPMYAYMQVLRVIACNATGTYEYAQVWEPFSLRCHCARPHRHVMPP